ncbi:MAG: ABC transporter permease [Thermofilum sp.]|nr:ABC transporter permease [Thermofilum sp.]
MRWRDYLRAFARSFKRSLKDYTVEVYVWWFAYLPTELLNIALGLASWYYYTRFVTVSSGVSGAEWFLSYVLLGIAIVPLLNMGIEQPEVALRSLYRGHVSTGGFRIPLWAYYYLAGVPRSVAAVSGFVFSFLQFVVRAVLYLLLGTLLFGVELGPSANYAGAVLFCALGFLACLGVGLILANTFWLFIYKEDVHENPFTWFVTTTATVLGGTYFPVDVLPAWLRPLSYAFPHVYVFKGLRKALLQGAALESLNQELTALTVYATISVLIGILLLRKVEEHMVYKARKV